MISPLQNLYNLRMARALPPAGGAGLSSLPPGPEAVLPAQSTDPIDDGIKTLMAYGRQATGQGLDSLISPTGMPVRRMWNGGMADDGIGTSEVEAAGSTSGGESVFGDGSGPGDYSYTGNEYGPTTLDAVEALAQSYDSGYSRDAAFEASGVTPPGYLASINQDPVATALGMSDRELNSAIAHGLIQGLATIASPVPGLLNIAKGLGKVAEYLGVEGKTQTADEAIAEQEAMGVGIGDGAPIRPYGDPYNAPKPVVSEPTPTPTEPDSFFRRQARMPLTLADIVGYATGQSGYQGGFPRFLPPVGAAQGGGISALAYGGDTAPTGYGNPAFEGMVPGTGTGMSDSVPFSIEGQQPALLSRDEYVLPADVVSQLGDGSSGAGADMLDNFVSQVRHSKYGQTQQPPANGGGLMSALMRHGGIV